MLPVIAIIGRANVGKSTLFNALTQRRDALVADEAGLTRDRRFGAGKVGACPYVLVDTGGMGDDSQAIGPLITQQALRAVGQANAVLFLVDARAGANALDEALITDLRRFNTPIHLVINKAEGFNISKTQAEFHHLGLGDGWVISAAHRQGLYPLMDDVLHPFLSQVAEDASKIKQAEQGIRVAIIGRPNVGKSTLINRMLGEERQLTFDMPGTTRDSIAIPFERDGQAYTLVDTAGVRRRSKVTQTIEKFSVIKALESITQANVVLMLFDGAEGMTDQDSGLLGYALDSGRALVLAVNKWDGLSLEQREQTKYTMARKLHFIDFAQPRYISALHGTNVGHLFGDITQAWQAANRKISTAELNKALEQAVESHAPPAKQGRRIKLKYIRQLGQNPPHFIIHGNQTDALPDSYKRYLINVLRERFALKGTPLKLSFKTSDNPFKDKHNTLTPRQAYKRQRLKAFVKKNK